MKSPAVERHLDENGRYATVVATDLASGASVSIMMFSGSVGAFSGTAAGIDALPLLLNAARAERLCWLHEVLKDAETP